MRTRCAQTGMPGRSSGVIEIDSDREESCVGDAPDGAVEAELLLGRRRRQTALSGDDESSADDGDNDEHDAYLHRCKQAAGQEEEEPSEKGCSTHGSWATEVTRWPGRTRPQCTATNSVCMLVYLLSICPSKCSKSIVTHCSLGSATLQNSPRHVGRRRLA